MAANDFTPTSDSPREADDAGGIKDTLAAAFAEHEAALEADAADADKGGVGDGADKTPPAGGDAGAGKKDEIGDQVAKAADAAADKGADKGDGVDKTSDADKKAAEEAAKSTEAPAAWSAKDKELFAKQSPEAKAFLLDRHRSMEADYTRKTQDLAGFRKEYEAVDQIFTPAQRENLKKASLTASQVIQGWANAELALQSGRGLDLIPGLAKSYKIDPIQLATKILIEGGVADPKAALDQIAEQAKNAPAQIVLPPDVQARLSKVDQLENYVRTEQQQRADTEVARIDSELTKFKTATDAAGALLNPYYDELVETMSQLVNQATATRQPVPPIDQLYQNAIFANPAVRQKWLDAKLAAERSTTEAAQQAAREKAAAAAKEKSEKARKAGSSVTGSSGSGQSLNGRRGSGSLRDELASAVEEAETVVH